MIVVAGGRFTGGLSDALDNTSAELSFGMAT